jgi:hypothetical protein
MARLAAEKISTDDLEQLRSFVPEKEGLYRVLHGLRVALSNAFWQIATQTRESVRWRAVKDELASRMPQRSEIHELEGYDL